MNLCHAKWKYVLNELENFIQIIILIYENKEEKYSSFSLVRKKYKH